MVLMRVHRSESNEELEGEDKTEHWDLGNVIGSHPQNPVHIPTTVDERSMIINSTAVHFAVPQESTFECSHFWKEKSDRKPPETG